MAKKQNSFFQLFIEQVDFCYKAAENLQQTLLDFDAAHLPELMEYLHTIENDADAKKHEIVNMLAHAFITPIEREDIYQLAQEIDDVTDSIEDVLLKVYMYNISEIHPEALEFSNIILNCCSVLKEVIKDFYNFKKSSTIKTNIIEINRLEELGDKLYINAVHKLYTSEKDPIEIISWTQTFSRMERCCDNCEDVADTVESIIMKNT